MRVFLGADHAGYELKVALSSRLAALGYELTDLGPSRYDPDDDYPPYCLHTAAAVVAEPGSLGVVVGGSGNGEQIAANKVLGARAALVWSMETARLAREHNDANLAAIGARQHTLDEATAIVTAFLTTPFPADDRHVRRIAQITGYEQSRVLPPVPDR